MHEHARATRSSEFIDTQSLIALCRRAAMRDGNAQTLEQLIDHLLVAPAQTWLSYAARLTADGAVLTAAALLQASLSRFPSRLDIRYQFACALWRADHVDRAESLLRDLIAADPAYPGAAMQLATLLRDQGRYDAVAKVIEAADATIRHPAARLDGLRFLASCQRQHKALELCERQLAARPADAELLAMAGHFAQETGRFDEARRHFLAAVGNGIDLGKWFVPLSIADTQRYTNRDHADFTWFRQLADTAKLPRARASALFALGKACDDIGDVERAAPAFAEANRLIRQDQPWSRDAWCDRVDATIASAPTVALEASQPWTPVFIVGLPRTGTTLIAELMSRHPSLRNRGELPTLDFIARRLAANGCTNDKAALAEAADLYAKHLRQDDAPAAIYVDKNPLNIRHVALAAAMFPNSRVVHCVRDLRDTALSIWMQYFANADYGFAYDLGDIAGFAAGSRRLMEHWRRTVPIEILDVEYETFVENPSAGVQRIFDFLGIGEPDALSQRRESVISSASRWQARQPVYARSVGRWRNYAMCLPELASLDDGA